MTLQNTDYQLRLSLRDGTRATAWLCTQDIPARAIRSAQTIPTEETMWKMIFTAALAALLATAAACGGNGGDSGYERLHPAVSDATYLQIQEGREYVTMTSSDTSRYLSDRINAIHQAGYQIEHATSDEFGYVLLVFRKIPRP